MSKKIILLKTGSTHPAIRQRFGDFEDWFLQAWSGCDVKLVNAVTREALPVLVGNEGVVITGSPAMVTDQEPWSERLAHWLREQAHGRVPILGFATAINCWPTHWEARCTGIPAAARSAPYPLPVNRLRVTIPC